MTLQTAGPQPYSSPVAAIALYYGGHLQGTLAMAGINDPVPALVSGCRAGICRHVARGSAPLADDTDGLPRDPAGPTAGCPVCGASADFPPQPPQAGDSPPSRPVQAAERTARVLAWMAANCHRRDVTAAEVAGVAGLSPRRLQAIFKRDFGRGPLRLMADMRMHRVHLALTGRAPAPASLAEAARLAGHSRVHRFRVAYRERYGQYPAIPAPGAPPGTTKKPRYHSSPEAVMFPPRGDAAEYLAGKASAAVPHSARVWNYWLGGKDHYLADREAGDAALACFPGLADAVRSLRYFSARVVRYLAAEAGVRQFVDIGAGMPFIDPVHAIAQSAGPGSRVVYADNDPLVLAHARALLTGPVGTVGYAEADLNNPGALLKQAATLLDFTRPVAILLFSVLGHIGDPSDDNDRAARSVAGELAGALPPGSFLAIGDLVAPDNPIAECSAAGAAPYRLRTPQQLCRLLDGLELTAPGVVPVCHWRPEHSPFPPGDLPAWGGVGGKT